MDRKTAARAIRHGAIMGMISVVGLIGWVFASGQTFGQRCEAVYQNTRATALCVDRLASGGDL